MFPLKYSTSEESEIEIVVENNPTRILLVEKEIYQIENEWLKEREQYKLTDGLGNTFLPDNDFSYRMTICVLQNLIGLLLYCTFMKGFFLNEILNIDDFSSLNPELRSYLLSTIITFIAIIFSVIFSVRKMLKGKKRFDKAKGKHLNQKYILQQQLY